MLEPEEAMLHPHNVDRATFVDVAGVPQPAPAPRFDRTPPATPKPPAHLGQNTDEALANWGFTGEQLEALRTSGAIA